MIFFNLNKKITNIVMEEPKKNVDSDLENETNDSNSSTDDDVIESMSETEENNSDTGELKYLKKKGKKKNEGDDGDGDDEDDEDDEEEEEEEDIDECEKVYSNSSSYLKYNDLIVNKSDRITTKYLTQYERTKILGNRTNQLIKGSKPLVKVNKIISYFEIAKLELETAMMPYKIKRVLPNGKIEIWDMDEFVNLKETISEYQNPDPFT